MTTPQNPQPVPPGGQAASVPEPFLSLHTTVVLLTALVLGLVVGGLTALTGVHPATAVIAGLTTAGAATGVLHSLIR